MTIVQDNATKDASAAKPSEVSDDDLYPMYSAMQCIDAVRDWSNRGCPEVELEMTVSNVMTAGCHRYRVAYTDVRTRVLAKYNMDERTLVRQVLSRFAVPTEKKIETGTVKRR